MKKSRKVVTGGQIILIPAEDILPNPFRPRVYFNAESLRELALSIEEVGILQPLTVRDLRDGTYQLISGERRLRAAHMAGVHMIPCVLLRLPEEKCALMCVTENLQRRKLNFFEEAQSFDRLHSVYGYAFDDIAQLLGVTVAYVINKMRLLKIPPEMRKRLIENGFTQRHAELLLRMNSDEDMEKLAEIITQERLSVADAEKAAAQFNKNRGIPKRTAVYYKDTKIFVNTVNRAIDAMLTAGIDAGSSVSETDTYIEYLVRIPK